METEGQIGPCGSSGEKQKRIRKEVFLLIRKKTNKFLVESGASKKKEEKVATFLSQSLT